MKFKLIPGAEILHAKQKKRYIRLLEQIREAASEYRLSSYIEDEDGKFADELEEAADALLTQQMMEWPDMGHEMWDH